MKGNVLARPEIKKLLDQYVVAELYTDREDDAHRAIDEANTRLMEEVFRDTSLPLYITLRESGDRP